MQGLRNMLLQEQKHLQEIADKARMGMSVEPEGHLRISRDKNKPRYYQCIDGNNEIYIPRSNKELPKLLAQSTYNRTVLKKVETRLKQIKKYCRIIQMMKSKEYIHQCTKKDNCW